MSKHPALDPASYPTLPTSKPTPQEEALAHWFASQQVQSVENLERAARQIITLCTTLLSVLLGLVALSGATPPSYMSWPIMRWLSMVGVASLFAALACSLTVVIPGAVAVVLNDPDALATSHDRLLAYKSRGLKSAVIVFGVAMFCLTSVLLGALWMG